ncbi:GNAT family N-acetyltransferase [Cohnella candidum]|uniref:GNAT family N-acetyltransferase n=1 Tax=Cohnella candidum TaxID=2674991 RepID=UPI0030B9867B
MVPTLDLIERIERSEIAYMSDRMAAITERAGNPEGVEVARFGDAVAYYSATMPWPAFNTVKGIRSLDGGLLDEIVTFYRERNRKAQFEIVPGLADLRVMRLLAERGFYQSGFHASMVAVPQERAADSAVGDGISIREIGRDEFETYAAIHCRGTGLPDDGIPYVMANNLVLHGRPGWKFYLARCEGQPAAVGVMHIGKGVASFTFAATLPEFRNKGLQRALLGKRMEVAEEHGCSLVVSQCAYLSPTIAIWSGLA